MNMLTQLSSVKTRLNIDEFEVKYDALLTQAIEGVSARFDRECNRTLARTINALQEFAADKTEIGLSTFPLESVSKFELKGRESDGWVEQTEVEYLVRGGCVLSLAQALGSWREQGRLTYTGGYVLPGAPPGPGQTALPKDLEQAAIEQVAHWFQNREELGLVRIWPHHGTYKQYAQLDLLMEVREVLRLHQRAVV
jgi:hypothetical protein